MNVKTNAFLKKTVAQKISKLFFLIFLVFIF